MLFGVLDGSNEVGPDNRDGAGDPNGRGTASAVIDGRQLCWGITVKNIDTPVAAHIHRGRSNRNGPVVVTLAAPEQGDPGASSGCVEISSSLARELKSNPNRFYWNVHTEDFLGGALRNQVLARRTDPSSLRGPAPLRRRAACGRVGSRASHFPRSRP